MAAWRPTELSELSWVQMIRRYQPTSRLDVIPTSAGPQDLQSQ
jgi:hypothetical protein